jgi:hypothetical protein
MNRAKISLMNRNADRGDRKRNYIKVHSRIGSVKEWHPFESAVGKDGGWQEGANQVDHSER